MAVKLIQKSWQLDPNRDCQPDCHLPTVFNNFGQLSVQSRWRFSGISDNCGFPENSVSRKILRLPPASPLQIWTDLPKETYFYSNTVVKNFTANPGGPPGGPPGLAVKLAVKFRRLNCQIYPYKSFNFPKKDCQRNCTITSKTVGGSYVTARFSGNCIFNCQNNLK